MSARFNTKFMISYLKLYKTFSCPSVSRNVYVGAQTERERASERERERERERETVT